LNVAKRFAGVVGLSGGGAGIAVEGTGDFEKSIVQAHRAMCLMMERRCPATPQNYELWFNYVAGHNRSLVDEIDRALAGEGILPQHSADKIYEDNLSPLRSVIEAADISKKIGGEMDALLTHIGTALDDASTYGQSLGTATRELGGAKDGDALRVIVERLVASTHQMEDRNRQLETNLNASREEIAELSTHLDAARNESRTDQLTALSNRKAFDETIRQLAAEAVNEGQDLCVVIGDVDHFKRFNDTYGHQTGDQVLRLVASCLQSVLKGRDFPARFGGEEFAILLPETALPAANTVANHIRKTVMSKKLVKKSSGEDLGSVTMSFGVAKYRAGESVEDVIHRADACLYAAKRGGRNLVRCETDPGVSLTIEAA
jgi:diguanylate cyclase